MKLITCLACGGQFWLHGASKGCLPCAWERQQLLAREKAARHYAENKEKN